MKLDAHYIEETVEQWCPICRKYKKGKMLQIYLPSRYPKNIAICNDCLEKKKYETI